MPIMHDRGAVVNFSSGSLRRVLPGVGLLDPSLTLTRTQHPAILSNSETKKHLTYAGFANLCDAQQPLTAHS